MADDIDDLLNEVDEYLDEGSTSSRKSRDDTFSNSYPVFGSNTSSKSKTASRRRSDMDSMIDDILDEECSASKNTSNNLSSKPPHKVLTKTCSVPISGSGQSKCFQLWLGGSSNDIGLSSAVYQRCCDSLRCTDCDFRISMFDNYQWHSSTDYLFLRNNMPDYQRLKSKLRSKKGVRAYACQCKWKTIGELTSIDTQKDIKWVCGKH